MTEETEDKFTKLLLEIPVGYNIKGRHFYMYQPTIGSGQLIGGLVKQLNLNPDHLKINPNMELLRVVVEEPELCLRIVALSSCKGKECLDNQKVSKIMTYLRKNSTPEDIVMLLQMLLAVEDTKDIEKQCGIADELAEYHRIQEMKGEKGSYTFGGKSIYGSIISTLAEKYGWTMDYIIWEITQNNIHLLLADAIKTIYLSDDERKRIHPRRGNVDIIRADDPANKEWILSQNWD